jgi:proteic killer suppression protein
MIKSFKHKGLEKFFYLDRLDASVRPQDMNLPGYKLHQLSGKEKGTWSVWVTGNWRVTFHFEGPDAVAVDYRDYH